jgi:UDPglucose 6-dehydrogenase/GDP-mannose 6-dehydrogenase
MALLKSVIEINTHQPKQVMDRLRKHFPDLGNLKVAVLGLAFKPGTDDMRESPAIPIVQELIAANSIVTAFDPVAQEEASTIFPTAGIRYCESIEDTVFAVDAVLLLTRWPEFKALPEILKGQGASPIVVDGRRLLPKDSVATYEGIGI